MKKYIIIAVLLFTGIVSAQENNPKLEAIGELVKTTYYFKNGTVQQEGFFKNGKLEGIWTSYDESGKKLSVATYSNGQKTGKWLFWNGINLNEVDYSNNRVAAVKTWKQDALVNN